MIGAFNITCQHEKIISHYKLFNKMYILVFFYFNIKITYELTHSIHSNECETTNNFNFENVHTYHIK